MKQKTLYPIWGLAYILCAVLGFIDQRNGAVDIAFAVIAVLFFIPGVLILVDAYKNNDKKGLRRLRYISLASLVLTLSLIVVTFASATGSQALGTVLHYALGILSAPMFCAGIWVLPIFLWACLFIASFPKIIGK